MSVLSYRERRMLKREIRRDLIDLRRANPTLTDEEFREVAENAIREEYSGINPTNLEMILEFLAEILPLILKLFV